MLSKVERPSAGEIRTSEPAVRASEAPNRSEKAGPAFSDVLSRLGLEVDRGERLVDRATKGPSGSLGAGDLIALQAGIYRYTEAVDLAAKLVDRATSAVKTTLGNGGGS